MEGNNKNTIDLRVVKNLLFSKKVFFVKVWFFTILLAALWIFPKPRYYDATEVLAPEVTDAVGGGGLSSLASSFGVNLNMGSNQDAIYPSLYPDLISSKEFLVSLFDIPVQTLDGAIKCDLKTYLTKHQKDAFYNYPINWLKLKIKKWTSKPVTNVKNDAAAAVNPFMLGEQDMLITEMLEAMILCTVNKKTDVVTIRVRSQDPYVSATLTDTICKKLLSTIIDYRTSKARNDVTYYENLTSDAKNAYEESVAKYSKYCDKHKDVILQSYISERDKLENEMSMNYTTYQAMETQLQAAKAKLLERTPAFTILQGATVPIKPAGPKRVLFIIGMLFLSTIIASFWIARKELIG